MKTLSLFIAVFTLTLGFNTSSANAKSQFLIDSIVAVVNKDVITRQELEDQVAIIKQRFEQNSSPLPAEAELREQVLEQMVLQKTQMQRARQLGINVSEKQIDNAMARVAKQNNLTPEEFLTQLKQDGLTAETFREEIKKEITLARLKEQEVEKRLQVSDSEIEAWLASQSGGSLMVKPQVNWVQFLIKATEDQRNGPLEDKAEDVESALEKGQTPEQILLAYPELDIEGTGHMGWQSFDSIPTLFTKFLNTANKDSVTTIESPNGFHVIKLLGRKENSLQGIETKPITQTRARHILLVPTEDLTFEEVEHKLNTVLQKLRQGNENFADLAQQYSVDGSASKGGDLGWLYPGDTVPEFERAMNALEPGQISDIVESRFGYHIIQVEGRREQSVSEERQRMAAKMAILEEKSEEAYNEWLMQLRDSAFIDIRL